MAQTTRSPNLAQLNQETHQAWEQNAAYWDARMGEGNDFVELLLWPALSRLLQVRPDWRVLDVACGNGLFSRRLAALGADVTAFDFSSEMIAHARHRSRDPWIDYRVLDATDEQALLGLGQGRYDAAMSSMALMDIADIDPLLCVLPRLLIPGGRFVFSVMHPCFNQEDAIMMSELGDRGQVIYSVKVSGYLTPTIRHGQALTGQPADQLYFHRSLQELLGVCFRHGFVLDGLLEPAFLPGHLPGSNPLGWSGAFSQFPPALVCRLRC